MRAIYKFFIVKILFISAFNFSKAEIHPVELLGKDIFKSFQNEDFISFYNHSVFSLNEEKFKKFLYEINNKNIRDSLISMHEQEFPKNLMYSEKWDLAFQHLWREELRHLAQYSKSIILKENFAPIINEAKEYGIHWKVTELVAVEVLVPVSWKNGRFLIKKDAGIDGNNSLFLDRNLSYRFTLDKYTYSKAFMIGTVPEDSDESYDDGIIGNGSGQGDILIRLNSLAPEKLFYFSPDQKKAGGELWVKNENVGDNERPNQRLDLLITFAYGQPKRAYQILVKDVLKSDSGYIFTERPEFLGRVPLPSGLNFSQ